MTTPDALREAFERDFREAYPGPAGLVLLERYQHGDYIAPIAAGGWIMYQAATRTALEQAARACEARSETWASPSPGYQWLFQERADGRRDEALACAAAVRSLTPATEASMDKPTSDEIHNAAIRWCGQKERETFPEDVIYFQHNWQWSPGLRRCVEEEIANRETTHD